MKHVDLIRWAEQQRCPECYGLGTNDDAEPGDISYRTWKCKPCNGSGFKNGHEHSVMQEPTKT